MKHASVRLSLSTIAFVLICVALATEALGGSPGDRPNRALPDGSLLTAAPYAQFGVSDDLTLTVSQGVVRVAGGKLSETTPVVIGTPSSTLTLRGGTAIVSVTPTSTVAILESGSGSEMKVVANGQTQSVHQPGWQVTTHAGEAPGAPALTPSGSLSTEIAQLPD
ncbi:hypothetical protein BH10PSE6_BH10PSE6_34830 [soil metagenome]